MIKRICASLPCLVVFTFCVIVLVLSSSFTDWHLVYAIDDSYIHLALARNLAETGVWGIRPDEYAFASSSPLWTCILAATFRLFGYHEIFAALYAVFFCVASTFVVERIFAFGIESSLLRRILTVGTMLALPVTTAAIIGMEHAMHVFSAVLLVYLYFRRAGSGAMLTRIHQDAWATGPLLLYAFDPDDEKFLANHLCNLQFEFPEGVSFVLREDLKKESE